MHVLKRDGHKEPVHFDKITKRIEMLCHGLDLNYVDPSAIALRVITNLYSGVTTVELDNLAAKTAMHMNSQHPDYEILAARIAISNLHKETKKVFSEVIDHLYCAKNPVTNQRLPLISNKYYNIVQSNADKLNSAIIYDRDFKYSYTTFKMLESYLLTLNGKIVERPQHMLMRVAVAIHEEDVDKAIETYNLMSQQYFIHSIQTIETACNVKQQMANSFLLTMAGDSIDGILDSLERTAVLFHYNGEIGFNVHCIRAKNTPIRGTGGVSNGLVPMLKAYDTSLGTVSRRVSKNGNVAATCYHSQPLAIYLEPWHADIYEFLDLKRSIGEEQLRARDMYYALWMPDLFMKRLFDNATWSLMCPHECPGLVDAYGDEFENLYTRYEKEGRYRKQVKAKDLWDLIIQIQLDSSIRGKVPYIIYKDHCNRKSNHQHLGTIKCSGFSPEIVQYSSSDEIAVCNTASIAVNMFVNSTKKAFDFCKLKEVVKIVTYNLDKMIDKNFYPLHEAKVSSHKHRSIGIGIQGLADAFILMRYPFDSKEANKLNVQIFETLYYGALEASCEIAIEKGSHESYEGSPVSRGILQYDMWNGLDTLKAKIAKHGIRNSLLIAQRSNEFMAQMLECSTSVQPYTNNIYTMSTLSVNFRVVKSRLLRDLMKRGLLNENMYKRIIRNNGSIQNIEDIPEDLKLLYRQAREMPQKLIFDMAVARGPFIDQSQCLNISTENLPEKLGSVHFFAWKAGLKSSMYENEI
nr:PREDICTED: ribonucleoside-diphosphate reductase large subunit-like [Linepithema humile]